MGIMGRVTVELIDKLCRIYYEETNREIESITIDSVSYDNLMCDVAPYLTSGEKCKFYIPQRGNQSATFYTPSGRISIKRSNTDIIKKTKDQIEALQRELEELENS